MKIALLTSPNQWFVPYAKNLQSEIPNASLFFDHTEIDASFEVIFILSYHRLISQEYLLRHTHNIVIHESALPKGKGWAPLFWQVLEGVKDITFTMFEASSGVDDGEVYMQKELHLTGYELNNELRESQANLSIEMCLDFVNNYTMYKIPTKQTGGESFYSKRTIKDSELDINKTIQEQFNLLRIVNNEEYPAFFIKDGHKYKLKIEKMEN